MIMSHSTHTSAKQRILFLCTGNACRSQMAEAWMRKLWGDRYTAFSAGIVAKVLDPRAVKAMAEAGVDIRAQKSKTIEALEVGEFDFVVTVCDNARESCPYFPAKRGLLHKNFEDPPALAADAPSEEEAMAHYRRVRDAIKSFVAGLPEALEAAAGA